MARRNNGPRLRYIEERGGYHICWTDPNQAGRGRIKFTGTKDRTEAEQVFADWLAAHGTSQPTTGPVDPSRISVDRVLALYGNDKLAAIETGEIPPESGARIGYVIDKLLPFFRDVAVADVTPATCRAYAKHRARAAGTVRRELGVLRAAVNHAWREGRITRPVPVAVPDGGQPRERWLTRDEAARLLRAARGPWSRSYLPLFILIGLYTGRRKEAICSLRWPQVDLVNRLIDFRI